MTTTDTTAAPKRGRARATIELPAASSATSVVDAIATAPAAGARQVLVEHLHLHPLNPTHRHDAGFEGLAELIRAQGEIREPLLVRPHRLIPEAFEVLSGARRLAAAQMLGMLMVPVRVVDVDDATAVAEVLAGNLERADFTESEEAALVQGVLDLGVSEADLAATLGRARSWVSRRRDVAALDPAARRVVDTAPEVDLVRAAAVAEFADDPEVYADLVEGIADADFDHAVERARQERKLERARRDHIEEILADDPDVTVLDEPPVTYGAGATAEYLAALAAEAGGRAIRPDEHRGCAGHAVRVTARRIYGRDDIAIATDYYCLAWTTSGHYKRHATPSSGATSGPMTDEQKAERKHLIETNKAAEAAQVVRRRWLAEFLTGDKMPKNAVAAALLFLEAPYASALEWRLARELYGTTWSDSPAKAVNRLVALGCATLESTMPKDYWRHGISPKHKHGSPRPRMYLAQLAEWGYALAPHEQDVVDGAAAIKDAS